MNVTKLLIMESSFRSLALAALVSLFTPFVNACAADVIRHVVVKGDTLSDISEKHLETPWLWPEIWKQNIAIENPHLIYPDDVLLISPNSIRLIRNTRLKVEKRSPKIRESKRDGAITTIDPSAITPFLSQSLVMNDDTLDKAGYVLQGTRKQIILGKGIEIFASGVEGEVDQRYQLFRIGRSIIDVKTQTSYGIEGVHLGSATMLQSDKVSKLYITDSNQEILPGDRITAMTDPTALPRYFPRKPNGPIETYVTMIPRGVAAAGRRDIVVIVGGEDHDLEAGDVLLIYSDSGTTKDPVTGKTIELPPLEIGAAMVFQVYEKVSYVIIMSSTGPIKLGDKVVSP